MRAGGLVARLYHALGTATCDAGGPRTQASLVQTGETKDRYFALAGSFPGSRHGRLKQDGG
jgi:hypothetical protein